MKSPESPHRLYRFVAWGFLAFFTFFTIVGMVVGPTRVGQAQDTPRPDAGVVDAGAPAGPLDAGGAPPLDEQGAPPATGVGQGDALPDEDAADAKTPEAATEEDTPADDSADQKVELRKIGEGEDTSSFGSKAISFLGIFALLGLALLMSNNRREVNWRLVGFGIGLQLLFAIIIFYMPGGEEFFAFVTAAFKKVLDFTDVGSRFVFQSMTDGQWYPGVQNFAFKILPTIIFFSSLMTIMYHLGVMQFIVKGAAWVMQKTMQTSGAETLSASANIFVGQTEAPLVVKPYIDEMTMSELMVVMTGGFATVAGGVMAAYVGMFEQTFPDMAGHLLGASIMSAPAALVVAKIIWPETETPETFGELEMHDEKIDANLLDAASRGAGEGLQLALNVGAMLLAFLALVALVNYVLGLPSLLYNQGVLAELAQFYQDSGLAIPDGCAPDKVADDAVVGCIETMKAAEGAPAPWHAPAISLELILGYLFWPIAWVMGVPTVDCFEIGQLLGTKMVVNEFVAYAELSSMLADPEVALQDRSVIIATYALCGFANFGSIGIQLGGIGGIAPSRKSDLARIALRAMVGGTIAAFMTATIAGILV